MKLEDEKKLSPDGGRVAFSSMKSGYSEKDNSSNLPYTPGHPNLLDSCC